MNEDLCKTCGERMEFFGSLHDGKLECPHCRQAEFIGEGVEAARLRDEEDGGPELVLFTADGGVLVRVPLCADPARDGKIRVRGSAVILMSGEAKTAEITNCGFPFRMDVASDALQFKSGDFLVYPSAVLSAGETIHLDFILKFGDDHGN